MCEDEIRMLDACVEKMLKNHEPSAKTASHIRQHIMQTGEHQEDWRRCFDVYHRVAEIYRKAFAVYNDPMFHRSQKVI